MQDRVILIGIKFQYNASSFYLDYTLNVNAKLLPEFLSPKRAIKCRIELSNLIIYIGGMVG